MKLYSNEIVFRGHPDKICDQISDAILDNYLKQDMYTRAGIETMGGKGKIFITGEVTSNAKIDINKVVKRVISDVGLDSSRYEIIDNIGKQSSDISQGVNIGGAGDNGMMFGYACNNNIKLLPNAQVILQEFSKCYDSLREINDNFLPDGKAQITGYYNDDFKLVKIKTFTICYQNKENDRINTDRIIRDIVINICEEYNIKIEEFLINPTGKFLIGGFDGDAGLTGRKIVVDSYQSFANVGGGAYSGKDATKVDRSGAYKARQIAKRYVNENHLNWCEVQLSYAIGKAKPLAIYIDSNQGNIEPNISLYEECTPINIINEFKLMSPIFEETAKFGHYGNPNFNWEK